MPVNRASGRQGRVPSLRCDTCNVMPGYAKDDSGRVPEPGEQRPELGLDLGDLALAEDAAPPPH